MGVDRRDTLDSDWQAIIPIPADAPNPPAHTYIERRAVSYSALYTYADKDGEIIGYIGRIERPEGGKEYRPLTYCENRSGNREWRPKGFPAPRPLYRLHALYSEPSKPVLVVEGEKAADAAALAFPNYIAITSPNGAKSAGKADWSPLAGRTVVVWPDNDAEGKGYAGDVARLAAQAGALFVGIVEIPAGFPDKWDLADPLPESWTNAALQELLEEASRKDCLLDYLDPATAVHAPYRLTEEGVEYGEENEDGDTYWQPVCSRLEIVADTRNPDGTAWGRLLRVFDRDGRKHEWAMPMTMLAGDGTAYREALLDMGLTLAAGTKAKNRLNEYIARTTPEARITCVPRIGWHAGRFILPDRSYGPPGEVVRLQTEAPLDHAFAVGGTLPEWQQAIGSLCVGNSRLCFAVSAAFAAPLLPFTLNEGGGFHLRGPSSVGKTTALRVASSVWGGGARSYIKTWRTTANGLEGTAQAHNHALLCLDEIGQLDGREIGQAAYMLANGEGKGRARKDGASRRAAHWQLLLLSTGEQSLSDKLAEVGKRAHAGQEARLVDLPADACAGYGLFEELHGFDSPAALARHLAEASGRLHGTPIRAFLALIADRQSEIVQTIRQHMHRFVTAYCPMKADGQVQRVAQRFGLVAAAGEVAAALNIVPWPEGEAMRAAEICFHAWLGQRGGTRSAEEREVISRLRRFLELHGEARFVRLDCPDNDRPVANRAGYRRLNAGAIEYLVFRETFRTEIFDGMDAIHAARILKEAGYLIPDSSDKSTTPIRVPGHDGSVRLYRIAGSILEGGNG